MSLTTEPAPTEEPAPAAPPSALRRRLRHAWRPFRQASRTSRVLVFTGAGIVIFFILLALIGPLVYEYGATQYRIETAPGQFMSIPQVAPPSGKFLLGTTNEGFDILARVIGGSRLALYVMVLAVAYAMVIGVPLGLISAYRGKWFDRIMVTVMDAIYAFPPLILAIIIAFVLQSVIGRGAIPTSLAVGVTYIPQYFRVVRNQTLSVKQEPFVEAAQSLGAKERTVISRYVFFNVVHSVPVILTLNAADAVLTMAALSFLGYGIEPPKPGWGYDISKAIPDTAAGIWWTALWPGVAIILLVVGLTLVGEGINDVVNPILRVRGVSGKKLQVRSRSAAGANEENEDTSYARAAAGGSGKYDGDDGKPSGGVVVRDLRVGYRTPDGPLWAVDGVSFDLAPGESLGLVGESGCGKSSLGRALMQLMPPGAAIDGTVEIGGRDIVNASASALRKMRGEDVSMVFQEPMTRLNPLMKVSSHFVETIRTHQPHVSARQAREMARDALAQVGIPESRLDAYPHEFSGGMRQRIMIALSIVLQPRMIVADEPTTSLDVIVESQILDILERLRAEQQVSLLFITHNLGIVAEACDKVAVMYAGKVVEMGTVDQIFTDPKHPYTRGLLASTISLETTGLQSIGGYPPDLIDPPQGCRYVDRCPFAMPHCSESPPKLTEIREGQQAACFLYPGAGAPVPDYAEPRHGNPQKEGV